jgi:hypothetical protein
MSLMKRCVQLVVLVGVFGLYSATTKAADPACPGDYCVHLYSEANWLCQACGGYICFWDCYIGEDMCWFEAECCDPQPNCWPPSN